MKIGLFFGTFDPIHLGHTQIAQAVFNMNIVDKIWFIVTPESPFKKNKIIGSKTDRIAMVSLALQSHSHFSPSSIEFDLPPPYYTAKTLRHITRKHSSDQFILIMGSDNYSNIHSWNEAEYILKNFQICVYDRDGHKHNNTIIPLQPKGRYIDVSSSYIRTNIECKSTERWLNQKVSIYIKQNYLYS